MGFAGMGANSWLCSVLAALTAALCHGGELETCSVVPHWESWDLGREK